MNVLAIAKADPLLTLHYFPEDEWHGELHAEARHASFSGKASAWFNAEALRQFVAPLRTFPPQLAEPISLRGGYFSDSTISGSPVETHVGIRIGQRGSKGRYWLEAQLADQDTEALPQSATIGFFVEPYALMRFAGEVDAMLESGGSVALPGSGRSDPDIVRAPCPVERPYSPLFMALREECSALIEHMHEAAGPALRTRGDVLGAQQWEQDGPRAILAQIDWQAARLALRWAKSHEDLTQASWSPEFDQDLCLLKQSALATTHPRAWFESSALHILTIAQDYLVEFFRDGPTDDIPYHRHLIYAWGTARNPDPFWIKQILFAFNDRRD